MKNDVFICHSSKDADLANMICNYLESAGGVHCWIAPRNITGGKLYAEEIIDAIENTQVFVLVFSESSNISNHVVSEVNCAFNAQKIILPFCVDESKMRSILMYYTNTSQSIFAFPNPKNKFGELKDAVLRNIPELQAELERKQALALLAQEYGLKTDDLARAIKRLHSNTMPVKGHGGEYDYAVCYNYDNEGEEDVKRILNAMKNEGISYLDLTAYMPVGESLPNVFMSGLSKCGSFLSFSNGGYCDLQKYYTAMAYAMEMPMYLCDMGLGGDKDYEEFFDNDCLLSLSDEDECLSKIRDYANTRVLSSGTDNEDESNESRYDLIENAAGELMVIINYRKSEPENPRMVYDGGSRALVYLGPDSAFMMNEIAPVAREKLVSAKTVLFVELQDGNNDVGREYHVPVRIVSSLTALEQHC